MHQVAVRVRTLVLLCLIGLGAGLQAQTALAVVDVALAPPVAVDDTLTTKVNRAEFVFVLDNDTDPDDDQLTVTTLTPTATHGTVSCDEFGTCEYTPNTAYVGPDGFDYTVSDGSATDVGHVSIQVLANTAPVAVDDDLPATAGRENVLPVLDNDTDADDDPLEITNHTAPAHGTVTCDFDCRYTPADGYTGPDSFDYTVSDGTATDVGHVSIQVTPNGPPVAVDDTAVRQDVVAVQVLDNDTDPESDELTVISITQPAHGTAAIEGGGAFVSYTATGAYSASDSFTYTVSDGFGETDTATVTAHALPLARLRSRRREPRHRRALDGLQLADGERVGRRADDRPAPERRLVGAPHLRRRRQRPRSERRERGRNGQQHAVPRRHRRLHPPARHPGAADRRTASPSSSPSRARSTPSSSTRRSTTASWPSWT